jgi:hypothetical protein
VCTDNGSSVTYADKCDDGPDLFDNSVAGLIVIFDYSWCVQTVVPMGHMLTSATAALTCSIIRSLT